MKKIIFLLVAVICTFAACDPVHEDIGNAGHITLDELKAKTTVSVDVDPGTGMNGNVISCETLAPVNAKWDIGGKEFVGNFAKKKMKKGDYTVVLTALCADGTELTASYPVSCQVITDELQKIFIYGEDPVAQPPFKPGAWNAAAMRFSDSEGQHFPYLSDDVYWGFKTLIMDVSDVEDGTTMMVHNGWWSATYIDSMPIVDGPNEIQLTEQIAKDCAKGKGGQAKDLQFLIKSGNCTVNTVYYEE